MNYSIFLVLISFLCSCSMGTIIGNGNSSKRPDSDSGQAANKAENHQNSPVFEPGYGNDAAPGVESTDGLDSNPVPKEQLMLLFTNCASPVAFLETAEFVAELPGKTPYTSQLKFEKSGNQITLKVNSTNFAEATIVDQVDGEIETSFQDGKTLGTYTCGELVNADEQVTINDLLFDLYEIDMTDANQKVWKIKWYESESSKIEQIKIFEKIDEDYLYILKMSSKR